MTEYIVIIEVLYMKFLCYKEREVGREMPGNNICVKYYEHKILRQNEGENCPNIFSRLRFSTWHFYILTRHREKDRERPENIVWIAVK